MILDVAIAVGLFLAVLAIVLAWRHVEASAKKPAGAALISPATIDALTATLAEAVSKEIGRVPALTSEVITGLQGQLAAMEQRALAAEARAEAELAARQQTVSDVQARVGAVLGGIAAPVAPSPADPTSIKAP